MTPGFKPFSFKQEMFTKRMGRMNHFLARELTHLLMTRVKIQTSPNDEKITTEKVRFPLYTIYLVFFTA